MRALLLASAFLVALAPAARDLAAQAPLAVRTPKAGAAFPAFEVEIEVDREGPSWQSRVLTAVGSALIGAGAGYFASQLARSDWDEEPGRRTFNRPAWAAVGGSVGFAVGLKFPISGPALPMDRERRTESPRSVITFEEVQDVSAYNAYDVVRLLRPEWLHTRSPNIIGEMGQQAVPVYLDDFHLGDVDSMRGVHVQTIELIRFVSPTQATYRWGTGHSAGVIQIVTVG